MKLKELKQIISSTAMPIDRIAGFSDGYDQMFDHADIEVKGSAVIIDTSKYVVNYTAGKPDLSPTVPEIIDKLHALPQENDDFEITFSGLDNENGNCILIRDVQKVTIIPSPAGRAGLSLQGREWNLYHDDDLFETDIIIEDERAQQLNGDFYDFIGTAIAWHNGAYLGLDDQLEVEDRPQGETFISFIADERESKVVTGLLAGLFKGVYFRRIPLTTNGQEERVSNDRECKYFGKYKTIIYPAFITIAMYGSPEFDVIGKVHCLSCECETEQEMEQFIAEHPVDASVGDIVQRITTTYIDPLDFIFEK